MKKTTKKAVVVRSTYHPVVKQYMDIIKKAFLKDSYSVNDVLPKEKIPPKNIWIVDSPLVAVKCKNKDLKKACVWYQGIAPEESFMSNNSKIRFFILSKIEKYILKKAGMVFLVSNEMKRFYEKKYKLDLDEKSVIMPCFNEQGIVESAFYDDKYKTNNFVYLGGLQKWQCFEETVKVYTEIEKKSSKPTKFFVFTAQKELALETLKKYGAKNYEVDFVAPDELSERIKSFKYGFVLREDNPVNNVATPTKFSNYLSNGIIPIYSDCIKSFTEYDKSLNLGVVCNINDFESDVDKILSHMDADITSNEIKAKCQTAFSDYYNQAKYIEIISKKVKEVFNTKF